MKRYSENKALLFISKFISVSEDFWIYPDQWCEELFFIIIKYSSKNWQAFSIDLKQENYSKIDVDFIIKEKACNSLLTHYLNETS